MYLLEISRAKKGNILIRNSSEFMSSLQHAGISTHKTPLTEVSSMHWQRYKSKIVGLCSFNNFDIETSRRHSN